MEVIGPWEFKDWEMDGVGQFFKLIKVVSLQTKEKYSVLGREEKKERF